MNQLTERKIINKLYEASQAGVKIELFVRGECILKPGISGLSENIKVYSTIGRFLEHSRVFIFCNKNTSFLKPQQLNYEFTRFKK